MSQIHLLIFDECHHARSRHPYNRIMQQFYHAQVRVARVAAGWGDAASLDVTWHTMWAELQGADTSLYSCPNSTCFSCNPSLPQEALLAPRPHIFGMTAAPADVRRNETQVGSAW